MPNQNLPTAGQGSAGALSVAASWAPGFDDLEFDL